MAKRNESTRRDATIYGESAHAIMRAVAKKEDRWTDSGMYQFDIHLTNEEAAPVVRAHMRIEAEMLKKDADTFDPATEMRTPEHRRADAFLELVFSAAAALKV